MAMTNTWPVNGLNPSTVGGTGTTAKYFPYPSGNFTSGVSPTPGPTATSGYGQLAVHGTGMQNGQIMTVNAAGDFEVGSGGACPSVTIDIVANTGTLISPTWTILGTTGAITAQTNTNLFYPWFLTLKLNGTSAAGVLNGTQSGSVDNTNAPAAGPLTNVLSGLNFNPTQFKNSVSGLPNAPVFGLAVRVTFSVSEPGNSANLYQFSIDQ